MALPTSTDGCESWHYFVVLDNITDTSLRERIDYYPSVLHVRDSLLMICSNYDGGPAGEPSTAGEAGYTTINVATGCPRLVSKPS